jgi:hypothetical protein
LTLSIITELAIKLLKITSIELGLGYCEAGID